MPNQIIIATIISKIANKIRSIFFAPLGAKAAHNINGKKLKKGFALFLLLLGVFVLSL
jgi:uncharacterized membrane protein YfcA